MRWSEKKRLGGIALLLLFFLFSLLACSREEKAKPVLFGSAQMNAPGYAIGVPQGTSAMTLVEKKFPKSKIEYHVSLSDAYLGVKYGKLDAFAFDSNSLKYVTVQNPELTLMDEKIGDESIVIGSAPGREDLMKQVNAFIRRYRADGTYRDMYERWILGKSTKMPDIPEPKHPAFSLKVATDGRNEPMNFFLEGRLTGFDVEFAKRLALFLNADLTLISIEYPAIVTAALTGKIDLVAANMNATPERRESMLFSDPYIDSEISFLVRKDRLPQTAGDQPITTLTQLAGKKIGVQTGTLYEYVLKEQLPQCTAEYFTAFTDQIAAVKGKKIAGLLLDDVAAEEVMRNTSGLTYLKHYFRSNDYAFVFSRNRSELRDRFNAAMKEMADSGAMQKLKDKWFGRNEALKVLPELENGGKNGTIRFATNSDQAPFVYMKNGRLVGYEIELAMTVARKLGCRLEPVDMDFAAIIPSLVSGKTDMGGAFFVVTKERAKSVLFSTPHYAGKTVVMVAAGSGESASGFGRVLKGLIESFRRTFMVENRYKLVLEGLWITVVISIFSAVAGTLLGFGVCLMRRSETRWANIPAKVFIRSIQGAPIVVLLMILYYIVFGSVDINGIVVAIIGFSISFAAYVSEMMRAGIEAVDKGQHEAAAAIGFKRIQVFTRITFPQAARHVLPVFKGEFISMLKMTSVVGYIAIQDLTKMSDIIRSRTYEAFFPLIATALIYFAVAYLMTYLLSLVEMKIDPKRRKRIVRGVSHS